MRDVVIGYSFIFLAVFAFIGSMLIRQKKLQRRIADLKEELRDSSRR